MISIANGVAASAVAASAVAASSVGLKSSVPCVAFPETSASILRCFSSSASFCIFNLSASLAFFLFSSSLSSLALGSPPITLVAPRMEPPTRPAAAMTSIYSSIASGLSIGIPA